MVTASAAETRTIPFACVLAATCSPTSSARLNGATPSSLGATPTGDHVQITVSALVPQNRSQPDGPLKLWTLRGVVAPDQPDETNRDPVLVAAEAGRAGHIGASGDGGGGSAGLLAKAERWCTIAEENAYAGVKRRRKLHCVVNPAGGKGKAKATWTEAVQPLFEAAGCSFDVSCALISPFSCAIVPADDFALHALADTGPPKSPENASAIAAKHPFDTYDALVAFSGDGIVHELLNGLANHKSGKGRKALRETPVVHVPCGSGNALATSLLGPEKVGDVRWAALAALKGEPGFLGCAARQKR